MAALGILDNRAPHELQPQPLADGVHLRWAFDPAVAGFPWHGYYLFRREHRPGEQVCVMDTLGMIREVTPTRALSAAAPTTLPLPQGELSSDQPLQFRDWFPAAGVPELDLEHRSYLRLTLPPGVLAHRVDVRIGFRKEQEGEREGEVCADFREEAPGERENPLRRGEYRFHVLDHAGAPAARARIVEMRQLPGLDCGFELRIDLPCPSPYVELELTHASRQGTVEALDRDGKVVDGADTAAEQGVTARVRLRGEGIARVVVRAPQNEMALHRICCLCEGEERGGDRSVRVRALHGAGTVREVRVEGGPGDVVDATLAADAITAVEFGPGPAVLVELCYRIAVPWGGWGEVPDFPYALCLPVHHPAYPCSGGRPEDEGASWDEARDRIRYGGWEEWESPFSDLHARLVALVSGGPGSSMAAVEDTAVPGVPDDPDPAATEEPKLQRFRHMDWVLLGALHPAAAQMLGLYWIDRAVDPGRSYDYLIVADHPGLFGGDVGVALRWVNDPAAAYLQVDGWMSSDVRVEPDRPLDPPSGVRAYALPGATRRRPGGVGAVEEAVGSVGLRWSLPTDSDPEAVSGLAEGSPVMHHLWRAGPVPASESPPTTEPAPDEYAPLKRGPVLVGEPTADLSTVEPPDDWPRDPMHAVDSALPEGWYAYRVSAVDVFGRHSERSAPAGWRQWSPAPDPLPWYFEEPLTDREVHPFAVGLLDKAAPPPPTAVEAFALDPRDPFLLRDAAYAAWLGALPPAERGALVGVRVRWRWTVPLMRQAPDAREFRVYLKEGRFNTLPGRIAAVAASGAEHAWVDTGIAHTRPADAFAGAVLQVGSDSFPVVASDDASPLRVRVRNLGPGKSVMPPVRAPCSVVVAAGTAGVARLDVNEPTSWEERVFVVDVDDHYTEEFLTLRVGDAAVAGSGAKMVGSKVVLGGTADLASVRPGVDWLRLEEDTGAGVYLIIEKNQGAGTVGVHGVPALAAPESEWRIGTPYRQYEVFLPRPDAAVRESVLPPPSLAEPVLHAQVGVSTADGRLHTADDAKWGGTRFGDRTGNEGRVGGPVEVFRVRRDPPPAPPAVPPDSERVYATPADYHGESFYTYRWVPAAGLKVHLFRASDESVFETHWRNRASGSAPESDAAVFPSEADEPRWDEAKRQQVAAELTPLYAFSATAKEAAMARYRGLSNDALRILASLPESAGAFQQITIAPLDPDDPANADRRGPDDPDGYAPVAGLRAHVDTLDGRSTNRYFYRTAYVDGAHNRGPLGPATVPVWLPDVTPPESPKVTKALGGDRQIALQWAAPATPGARRYRVYRTEDPESTRDLRLMGAPVADLPATQLVVAGGEVGLGAATDVAAVERVYAARELAPTDDPFVGESATQYLGAPVDPSGPVVTGLAAPDGTEVVVVYRDSEGALQRTPCLSRPRYWLDGGRVGGVECYYLLVAVKESTFGGATWTIPSRPSEPVRAAAVETTPPDPATWRRADFDPATGVLELEWETDYPQQCVAARQNGNALNRHLLTEWLTGDWNTGRGAYVFRSRVEVAEMDPGASLFVLGRTLLGSRTRSAEANPVIVP